MSGGGTRLAVALLAAALAAPVLAHRLARPQRDELRIEPGRLVLTIRVDREADDEEARALVDRADRDGDGRLNAGERAAAGRMLAAIARRGVALRVAGTPVPLRATAEVAQGLEEAHPDHIGVDLVLEGEFPSGAAVEVEFEDRSRRAGVPVALTVRVRGYSVAEASSGRAEVERGGAETALVGIDLAAGTVWRARLAPAPGSAR